MPFSNIYQKLGYLFSPQNRVEVQIKTANNFSGSFNAGAVEAAVNMSREAIDLADGAFSTVIRCGVVNVVKTKIELTEQGIAALYKNTAQTQIVVALAGTCAVAFLGVAFLGVGYFLTSHLEPKNATSVLTTLIACTAGLCAFAI